jgi:hypothetical protein
VEVLSSAWESLAALGPTAHRYSSSFSGYTLVTSSLVHGAEVIRTSDTTEAMFLLRGERPADS